MKVLVTGGAGYIGSHTVLALLRAGHNVVVVDNLSNSSMEAINRVRSLSGIDFDFHHLDLLETEKLTNLVKAQKFDSVIHFAGSKSVGESVTNPVRYFNNNIGTTVSLLQAFSAESSATPPQFIFSSSATVYGDPQYLPINEDHPVGNGITNPYGFTKFVCENLLKSVSDANPRFQAVALRYFNPIGADPSGLIGEDPHGIPNNLAPYITQVASGKLSELTIFGDDYKTPDGTGVRDYIHVSDVADGHVAALSLREPGFFAINLGTGEGTSVKELLLSFEGAVGFSIASRVSDRRPGDIASCYADTRKAYELFGWQSSRSIDEACRDAWNWQEKNPSGYSDSVR
jgi:UDP-glucose 4-epimerase